MRNSTEYNESKISKALDNLEYAFRRESESCAMYTQFSINVRRMGYESLATLFLACSHSEWLHATRHARVALFLGRQLTTPPVEIKEDTVANMLDSMIQEEQEAYCDYPQFVEESNEDSLSPVALSMMAAFKADETHLLLCKQARHAEDYWKNEVKQFSVCSLCGNVREPSNDICALCSTGPDMFVTFPEEENHKPLPPVFSAPQHLSVELGDNNIWCEDRVFPNTISPAIDFVADLNKLLSERNWSDRDIFAINMAVVEAAANAVEHGNGQDNSKHYQIVCTIADDFFFCFVKDEGNGFIPTDVPDPSLLENRNRIHGRGLKLISSLMTRTWFNQTGNAIFMVKTR